MLNKLDDYPIHQTPEPIAIPATSDPNVYDRTWFNGYLPDGKGYFGLGMAIYPHRKVMDCAFAVVTTEGRQHSFIASRSAPLERTEMRVGPFNLEVVEPLRRARVTLDDNETGIACDLTFSARTSAIEEARQTLWSGNRRAMDATRFDQFGLWNGSIRHPDGEVDVSDWYGTKDRSWGVRGVGEPVTTGAPMGSRSIFFLWAPLIWDQPSEGAHVSHAIFFDGTDGRPLVREGITAPWFASEADIPAALEDVDTRMLTARHRVAYHAGTRLASGCELDLVPIDGPVRTISLEPMLRFQMKGLGYNHPTWKQGMWHGELALTSETYELDDLDLADPHNFHVQQVVRATDGDRVGWGVLEQIVLGPYAPGGFTGPIDVAG